MPYITYMAAAKSDIPKTNEVLYKHKEGNSKKKNDFKL